MWKMVSRPYSIRPRIFATPVAPFIGLGFMSPETRGWGRLAGWLFFSATLPFCVAFPVFGRLCRFRVAFPRFFGCLYCFGLLFSVFFGVFTILGVAFSCSFLGPPGPPWAPLGPPGIPWGPHGPRGPTWAPRAHPHTRPYVVATMKLVGSAHVGPPHFPSSGPWDPLRLCGSRPGLFLVHEKHLATFKPAQCSS